MISYILSDDHNYIVKIINKDHMQTFREYSHYLSILIPALLLALGVMLWLYLFRRELKTLKYAAGNFGKGELDTRTQLSKSSTLFDLSNAFNTMAERIQNLLQEHRDLTNAVSHELKTPLSRLRFALEMQKDSKNEQDKSYYTAKIEDNILNLEDLIDELLSYTRLQREQKSDLEKHNVSDWLIQEVATYRDYHPNIVFQQKITVNQEAIFDKHQMSRALSNLLDNAVKYAHSKVRVTATTQSDALHLSVEDDGVGIQKHDIEKIFEPFTRLDKSRQRQKGSYGMGLAIVKSIIKLHAGKISYEQSKLGGAAFHISIPPR